MEKNERKEDEIMENLKQEKPEQLRDQMEGTELSDEDLEAAAGGWFKRLSDDHDYWTARRELIDYVAYGNAKCPRCSGFLEFIDKQNIINLSGSILCFMKCSSCHKDCRCYYEHGQVTLTPI